MTGYRVFYCGYCAANRRFWRKYTEEGGEFYCGVCGVPLTLSMIRCRNVKDDTEAIILKEYTP